MVWSCITLLATIAVAVAIQVTARYVFNRPTAWSEQLAQYAFIWLTLLGAALVTRAGSHLGVSILQEKLSGRPARVVAAAIGVATLVLLAFWFDAGIKQVSLTWDMTEAGLNWRLGWVYLSVPVASACMAIFVAERIVRPTSAHIEQGRDEV